MSARGYSLASVVAAEAKAAVAAAVGTAIRNKACSIQVVADWGRVRQQHSSTCLLQLPHHMMLLQASSVC
jgi:hypothetical protein